MTAPIDSGTRLTPVQWLICAIAAIGFAFDIYEILMLPLIVRPALLELTGAAPGSPQFQMWVGRLFYIPAFAGGIFGLLGGYLTDLFGRRRILTYSILIYAIAAFLSGFSTSIEMLLVLRCFVFVGVCVEFVAAVAWIAEIFPDAKQREAALGYTQAFSSIGGLMVTGAYYVAVTYGPQLPAIAGGHSPWRYTLISGVIPALPLIVIRPFLPESPAWQQKKAAGTLRRPSIAALFTPELRRTTIVTTLMFAFAYGAAFGAIQQMPRIVPGLAERWEQPDERTYVFHLRRGVRFHHGRELTAEDIRFTFESLATVGSPHAAVLEEVHKIRVLDPYRVAFHLKRRFAPILYHLTVGIVPAELAGRDGFGQQPVGTGPFRFKRWVQNERVEVAVGLRPRQVGLGQLHAAHLLVAQEAGRVDHAELGQVRGPLRRARSPAGAGRAAGRPRRARSAPRPPGTGCRTAGQLQRLLVGVAGGAGVVKPLDARHHRQAVGTDQRLGLIADQRQRKRGQLQGPVVRAEVAVHQRQPAYRVRFPAAAADLPEQVPGTAVVALGPAEVAEQVVRVAAGAETGGLGAGEPALLADRRRPGCVVDDLRQLAPLAVDRGQVDQHDRFGAPG